MQTIKERAKAAVKAWEDAGHADATETLAAVELLREIANAPEPEPVAFQVRNGWASVAIYQRQIDAENYAKDQQKRHDLSGSLTSFRVVPLYTVPPAQSVPDGWRGLTDVEWMNIVNFDCAYASYDKEGAVNEAVKRTEEKLKELNATQQPEPPCAYCDGTGDVHSIDGEWRGICTECEAGKRLAAQQQEPPADLVRDAELVKLLELAGYELSACQAAIQLRGGFDQAYVKDAQAVLKKIDAVIERDKPKGAK